MNKRLLGLIVGLGIIAFIAGCAFFYPLEVYNTVNRLRNATNDDGGGGHDPAKCAYSIAK